MIPPVGWGIYYRVVVLVANRLKAGIRSLHNEARYERPAPKE